MLHEAGVWDSPRVSDGIIYTRMVKAGVCGRLYEIDQTLHAFWLEREGPTWRLYYDVIASSPRRARNAIDEHDDPTEIEWRFVLEKSTSG